MCASIRVRVFILILSLWKLFFSFFFSPQFSSHPAHVAAGCAEASSLASVRRAVACFAVAQMVSFSLLGLFISFPGTFVSSRGMIPRCVVAAHRSGLLLSKLSGTTTTPALGWGCTVLCCSVRYPSEDRHGRKRGKRSGSCLSKRCSPCVPCAWSLVRG